MPKRATGLYKRWSRDRTYYWWEIDKTIDGQRIRQSTGTPDYAEAERQLARIIDQRRQREVYGITRERTFDEAAARYVDENDHKRSLDRDIQGLEVFMPDIAHLPLHQVHQGTLQPTIDRRRQIGVSPGTINRDMAGVRRVLTLSARLWRDEAGRPWLATVPMLPALPHPGRRPAYPLTWDEQRLLFGYLPAHLERMARFSVHTGMRDQEICQMRWSWLAVVDGHTVIVIPRDVAKNGEARIAVANREAEAVLSTQRGAHGTWVWPSSTKRACGPRPRVHRMMGNGWRSARAKAAAAYPEAIGDTAPWGFANVRVHDLRHTFGRRLRAAGVSEEDRRDLLGHSSGSITTDYSAAEIHRLIESANLVCDGQSRPMLRVVG